MTIPYLQETATPAKLATLKSNQNTSDLTTCRVFSVVTRCDFLSPKTLPAIWCGSRLPRPRSQGNRPSRRPWCACDTFLAWKAQTKTTSRTLLFLIFLHVKWLLQSLKFIYNGLYICCKFAQLNLLRLTLASPYSCYLCPLWVAAPITDVVKPVGTSEFHRQWWHHIH